MVQAAAVVAVVVHAAFVTFVGVAAVEEFSVLEPRLDGFHHSIEVEDSLEIVEVMNEEVWQNVEAVEEKADIILIGVILDPILPSI